MKHPNQRVFHHTHTSTNVPPSGVRASWRPCRLSLGSWPGGFDSPCTFQQCVLTVFWQASAREEVSAILEKGSPGRDQDKSHCCQHVHCHNGSGCLPKRNSGGTFYAIPTQGHLSCKKQNHKARIKSKHIHAITNRKTKALIEYMRAMISCWLQHTQITTPSRNKKQKNLDQSINSHLNDLPISSCEVAAGAFSYQSQFFMTVPNFHRYSPLIECIQIWSMNWLYGAYGAYKAQGIPTVKGSPDKEGGRVFWITLREESYWGLMVILSPMLAYVELQTPPPARTATVTDDISPG